MMRPIHTLTVLLSAGCILVAAANREGISPPRPADSVSVDISVLDNGFPIRAFSVALPSVKQADTFFDFVENDLAPAGIINCGKINKYAVSLPRSLMISAYRVIFSNTIKYKIKYSYSKNNLQKVC